MKSVLLGFNTRNKSNYDWMRGNGLNFTGTQDELHIFSGGCRCFSLLYTFHAIHQAYDRLGSFVLSRRPPMLGKLRQNCM
ncbi:hypothetical protein C5167_049547 [Papaver somniferum]|uniref:Uncharacterized protein n=1 Tax=Papaver somniferum TaxID=3469 RepID=A0A4Y7KPM7_PAPSO|nr:hypothetical protein C5167_049547 [Papaver somniferum]